MTYAHLTTHDHGQPREVEIRSGWLTWHRNWRRSTIAIFGFMRVFLGFVLCTAGARMQLPQLLSAKGLIIGVIVDVPLVAGAIAAHRCRELRALLKRCKNRSRDEPMVIFGRLALVNGHKMRAELQDLSRSIHYLRTEPKITAQFSCSEEILSRDERS